MLGKIMGKAQVVDNSELIQPFLLDDEIVNKVFKFVRDELVFTNYGIYYIDVQGLSGKKKQFEYYPKEGIEGVIFETAGTLDLDSDLKLLIKGRSHPLGIKVAKSDEALTQEIIKFIKQIQK